MIQAAVWVSSFAEEQYIHDCGVIPIRRRDEVLGENKPECVLQLSG